MEFHVSREARERYAFDGALFSLTGNVVAADFRTTREVARRMNAARDVAHHPELAVQPGQLNAMGLIDEILHHVSALYRRDRNPAALEGALAALDARLGRETVDATLVAFVERYPPVAVFSGDVEAARWLDGETDGLPNRQVALEELLQLWLANVNPAFAPFRELFDDRPLAATTSYPQVVEALSAYFVNCPGFGPEDQPLVALLRSPAIASPESLSGQLRYIRERWGLMLERRFGTRLAIGLDVLSEEERALWLRFHGADEVAALARGQRVGVYQFGDQELEPERFSMDRDWMPRLVLLAKSTYVWLDQIAKAYQREVRRLDQVPDEELDRLARWGFTGLWLIGVWERSRASERIKKLRGNPDAVASAYSLLDYRIAEDLGGEAAYENLRDRAWRRGIRLASDMVPNHMGIDSAWVMDHPDWFIGVDEPPFASYSFGGPDLSSDPGVGLWIEDHYYDNSDAAVVFRREDRGSGRNAFIYHGNDGTSMPWNDTAQLDYLLPDVREAVIQTILAVARRFPVIRFDAAMTLAKKHYQRLWYPEPGTGGAIPSRAEHGMTRGEFDERMPVEFWREVVDRVAAEAPDTLLLAEAFWLMEGYFVRTLGMHRVYNSAFMNMLRDEENANYRSVMKNTLEFDPEILKRYVNFMNNPDERTAVDQFGTGDKYFGVATIMATMPGLPMFGHGQIEGFGERYGMEFRRAYWDEQPNEWLVARHEREIFPLLHRRHLFAEVHDFLLYDVFDQGGRVNEDVFAYSNRAGGERSLVVYHNRYAEARGWIRESVAYAVKGDGDEKALARRSLGDGLGLTNDERHFCVFRDLRTGLEYLRPSRDLCEHGMYIELGAYQCHVFVDVHEVRDDVGLFRELSDRLGGAGAPSLDEALRELALRPVQEPVRALVSGDVLRRLLAARRDAAQDGHGPAGGAREAAGQRTGVSATSREAGAGADASIRGALDPAAGASVSESLAPGAAELLTEVEARARAAYEAAARVSGGTEDAVRIATDAAATLAIVLGLPGLPAGGGAYGVAARRIREEFPDDLPTWSTLLLWTLIRGLGRVHGDQDAGRRSRDWLDGWGLAPLVADGLRDLGLDEAAIGRVLDALRAILPLPDPTIDELAAAVPMAVSPDVDATMASGEVTRLAASRIDAWLIDPPTASFLGVNVYAGVAWFGGDGFARLLRWSFLLDVVELRRRLESDTTAFRSAVGLAYELALALERDAAESGYRVDRLLEIVRRPGTPDPGGSAGGGAPRG